MGAEQRISASVYTHRGDGYGANTSSFILDGRYPKGFELDNSSVSIAQTDRNFFFAICDTKRNDRLNESVSGIKELRKIGAQFKTSSRDIRAKTEALGECLIETENLLYDTAAYSDDGSSARRAEAARQGRRPAGGQLKGGASARAGDDDDAGSDVDADVEEEAGDGYGAEQGASERDGDGDDGEPDSGVGDDDEDAPELAEPGAKGFSSVVFLVSDTKGSILAQGDCTALLLRDNALRIVSGGARRSDRGDGSPSGYGGRASAVFELRDGDVFLLCTTTILDAIGEDSVDGYLGMMDDVSTICYEIMGDAVEADPTTNMTCMVVRVEERVDEAEEPLPLQHGQQQPRDGAYGAAAGAAAAGGMAARGTMQQPAVQQPVYQQQAQQQYPPQYSQQYQQSQYPGYQQQYGGEFDPRLAGAAQAQRAPLPYGGGGIGAPRSTTKFQPPPKQLSFGGRRNVFISVGLTVGLLLVLVVAMRFFAQSTEGGDSSSTSSTSGPSSSTSPVGDDLGYSTTTGDDTNYIEPSTTPAGTDPVYTTTQPTTTQTTTTEAPEVVHKVRAGDTLSGISQTYYNSSRYYTLIKEANGLESDTISIGQNLIIPPLPDEAGGNGGGGAEAQTTTRTTAPRISTQ